MLRTARVTVKALQNGSYCRTYDLRGWESNISTNFMLVHDKKSNPIEINVSFKSMTEGSPNRWWWLLLSAIPTGLNDAGILEFLCERAWPFWGTPLEPEWMQVLPYPTAVHLVETGRADVAPILLEWVGQPWEVLWLDILPSGLFYPSSKGEPLTTCSPSMGFWPFCLDIQLPYLSAKLFGSISLVALVQGTHSIESVLPKLCPKEQSQTLFHYKICVRNIYSTPPWGSHTAH